MEINIVGLYRSIGNLFRENGADKVALLSSKTNQNSDYEMTLEVAVDGFVDMKKVVQLSREYWPYIELHIFDLNKQENRHLIEEINEGGILL